MDKAEVQVAEPGEAVDLAEFRPLLEELFERIKGSIREHGDWRDYGAARIFDAVTEEWDEYREAFVFQQFDGDHGQIDELWDVAVTALKGVRQLRLLQAAVVWEREHCRQTANAGSENLPVLAEVRR